MSGPELPPELAELFERGRLDGCTCDAIAGAHRPPCPWAMLAYERAAHELAPLRELELEAPDELTPADLLAVAGALVWILEHPDEVAAVARLVARSLANAAELELLTHGAGLRAVADDDELEGGHEPDSPRWRPR